MVTCLAEEDLRFEARLTPKPAPYLVSTTLEVLYRARVELKKNLLKFS